MHCSICEGEVDAAAISREFANLFDAIENDRVAELSAAEEATYLLCLCLDCARSSV